VRISLQRLRVRTFAYVCAVYSETIYSDNGLLLTWGDDSDGALGMGDSGEGIRDVAKPSLVPSLMNLTARQIACGTSHCILLVREDAKNRLFAWGKCNQGTRFVIIDSYQFRHTFAGRLGIDATTLLSAMSTRGDVSAVRRPIEIFLPAGIDTANIHSVHACADASAVLMNDGMVGRELCARFYKAVSNKGVVGVGGVVAFKSALPSRFSALAMIRLLNLACVITSRHREL
jgi:alpha-tubulin suppressor-like RCC1 family protein